MIHYSRALRRLFLAVTVSFTVVLGGITSPALADSAPTSVSSYESDTAQATNAYRSQIDRPSTSASACLGRYADTWAKKIADQGKLVHQSTKALKKILKKCKLKAIGENLAYGQKTGADVVAAWKKSAPHDKNLKNKRYRKYGYGSYWDGSRWWTVQLLAGK